MGYNVEYTKNAQDDVIEIEKYISQDNADAAKRVLKHIRNYIENLKSLPSIGKYGKAVNTREIILNKYPYKIIYRVKGGIIQVIRILHTSRKWGED